MPNSSPALVLAFLCSPMRRGNYESHPWGLSIERYLLLYIKKNQSYKFSKIIANSHASLTSALRGRQSHKRGKEQNHFKIHLQPFLPRNEKNCTLEVVSPALVTQLVPTAMRCKSHDTLCCSRCYGTGLWHGRYPS